MKEEKRIDVQANVNVNVYNGKRFDTLTLVELAALIAIIIIMGTTVLGTIRTPFLSISLVTIPVAVGAIVIGPVGGLICGAAFGLTSLFNAVTGTSGMMTVLLSVNAFGAVFTILVPRCLEGLLTAYLYKLFRSLKLGKLSYYLGAICCPLLNTLLFMSCIVLFFYNSDYIQGLVTKLGSTNPIGFVIALVGFQGLVEAVSCCVVGGVVSQTLCTVFNKSRN